MVQFPHAILYNLYTPKKYLIYMYLSACTNNSAVEQFPSVEYV